MSAILFYIIFLFLYIFQVQDSTVVLNKNDSTSVVQDSTSMEKPVTEPISRTAFQNGEKLTFRIRYGFITAGTAQMMVFVRNYNSRLVYQLSTTARSASAFSWIYEVHDVVNSFVDYDKFYPLRFEKKLREGSYKADLYTNYIPEDSLAKVEFIRYTDDMKIKKKSTYDVKVPPYSQDVLSSFYYIRLQNLKVGESVFLTNHEKKKVYNMEIIVHKKETIEVEAGTFKCIMVEPVIKGEGLFKKKGRLRVWLTDDDKKIPVQMKSEVLIGSITTELTKIEGVDGDIAAKVN